MFDAQSGHDNVKYCTVMQHDTHREIKVRSYFHLRLADFVQYADTAEPARPPHTVPALRGGS